MQRYKVAAAQRTQKQLQNLKFQHVVEKLIKYGPRIRASYDKYLDFNGETLAWMMAVDASFLLEFLQIFAFKQGKELTRVSSRMSHLVDVAGRKSAYNAILRDIVMLENQIPLFLLRKMLKIQFSSMELAENMLVSMLMGLGKELSPFKFLEEHPHLQISKRAHLLDVLYHVFMPEFEEPTEITEAEEDREKEGEGEGEGNSLGESSHIKQCFGEVWKFISKLDRGALRSIKRLLFSRPIKVILKLPWTIVSKLPGFKVLKQGSEYFCFPHDKENIKPENENSNDKPLLVEEISIPSVTQLSRKTYLKYTGNQRTEKWEEREKYLALSPEFQAGDSEKRVGR
ncbi:unnamed protein product [Ilex paraguariensis]|uniref:Uncharacterized protein n=1 Tax=Ilex paraguariensis TaxID=185542 RepID=A0ABC8RY24_9AQUA